MFDLLMVAAGLWLIRRSYKLAELNKLRATSMDQENKIRAIAADLQRNLDGLRAKYEADEKRLKALLMGNRLTENSELDRLILENALKRENRAKNALLHVLRENRCSEEDIGRIMAAIDKED